MLKILQSGAIALALVLFGVMPAQGMGSDSGGSSSSQSSYDKAVGLIKKGRHEEAITLLEVVVKAEPRNADAWNYLGFAQRNVGRYDEAFASYDQALKINPKHDGANEYLGELYLMTGDLESAEAQLEILDKNCSFSCSEYKELKAAIETYKKKQGS